MGLSFEAGCGIRSKLEAGCGMKSSSRDVGYAILHMRDDVILSGPGYAVFHMRDAR